MQHQHELAATRASGAFRGGSQSLPAHACQSALVAFHNAGTSALMSTWYLCCSSARDLAAGDTQAGRRRVQRRRVGMCVQQSTTIASELFGNQRLRVKG